MPIEGQGSNRNSIINWLNRSLRKAVNGLDKEPNKKSQKK